ncbi:conjugal transfer protein [Salmonella enterica]
MKKIIFSLALVMFSSSAISANSSGDAATDLLTGDTRLACEAILCLSSSAGKGISECAPSLKKYFSISAKKMKDTIKKRKNFLKLCPAAEDEGMPELVETLSKYTGHCKAEILNRELVEEKRVIIETRRWDEIEYKTVYKISSKLPSDCKEMKNNKYTDYNDLHYTGISEWQDEEDFKKSPKGKWVD